MRTKILLIFAVIATAFPFQDARALVSQLALDNTADGTAALTSSSISLSSNGTRRRAVTFTTPGEQIYITSLRFGFQRNPNASAPATYNLHIDLMAVNGSNLPTGSALATVSQSVTVTTTPVYFTYDVATLPGSTFDDYRLLANTKYSVNLYTSGGDGTFGLIWNATGSLPAASNGFTYNTLALSGDSGSSWGSSTSVMSSFEMMFAPVPVPEPGNAVLAGVLTIALAAGLGWRRLRA